MKKKIFGVALVVMLSLAIAIPGANAASAKATAAAGNLKEVVATSSLLRNYGWETVLENQIKTSSQKDLFVDVSLECGLTTNTKATSKQLARTIADAEAAVYVRVLVDGVEAYPGVVTFAKRRQVLIAEFAGDITGCLDEYGHVDISDPTCIQEESVALILDTLSAHAFNFIANDVGVGTHTITVEAKTTYVNADLEDGDYPATSAWVGKGSMTVEEVRMIQDEDIAPEI
jgi:hypothetical protein